MNGLVEYWGRRPSRFGIVSEQSSLATDQPVALIQYEATFDNEKLYPYFNAFFWWPLQNDKAIGPWLEIPFFVNA